MRLDIYLTQKTKRPRSHIQQAIHDGLVSVNGKVVTKPSFLITDETVEYKIPEPKDLTVLSPEEIPIEILYEDASLLVVNKPAGMVTHPAVTTTEHTLVNALLYRYPDLPVGDDPMKPGIVHRLDKGTSGCLVVAKTLECLQNLQKQFKAREVQKIYRALVVGSMHDEGRIEKAIGRHLKVRHKISSHTLKGKEAITEWKVLEHFGTRLSWVEVYLHTGRTHQIRVHFAEAGHPVVGDLIYGRRQAGGLKEEVSRPCLHAFQLGFAHPKTGEKMFFEAPLPEDLTQLLKSLRRGQC
ncbi:MAG: RluA family pseudouridine synthase [Deltaproteobacteria bacterium]|nr:RluA family pseudouridine synthase [Deltaproteobacteria bacterium]